MYTLTIRKKEYRITNLQDALAIWITKGPIGARALRTNDGLIRKHGVPTCQISLNGRLWDTKPREDDGADEWVPVLSDQERSTI